MTGEEELVWLEQRRDSLDAARQAWEQSVREAHKMGLPLREIAKAAGVSHEQVRRLIRSDQT